MSLLSKRGVTDIQNYSLSGVIMRCMLLILLLNVCMSLEMQFPASLGIDTSLQGGWTISEVSYDGGKTVSPLYQKLLYTTASSIVFPRNNTVLTASLVTRATHEGHPGWLIQFSNSPLGYLVLKTAIANEFVCLVIDIPNKKEDMRFVFRVGIR
jgi:hypothetical protein